MKQSLLKRNVVQVLLALLLLVGVGAGLGMTAKGAAYAEDDATNLRAAETILGGATISAASTSTLADIQPGDIVQVGTSGVTYKEKTFTYGTSGAAPQWRVLAVEEDADTGTKTKALLLSEVFGSLFFCTNIKQAGRITATHGSGAKSSTPAMR